MKQFNLEEYLKDPSKKIVTREGLNARIIYTEAKGKYPVIALIEDKYIHTERSADYTVDGKFISETTNHKEDLFFATEKHTGWANIYGAFLAGDIFSTKEEADEYVKRSGSKDFVATAKIEWEE